MAGLPSIPRCFLAAELVERAVTVLCSPAICFCTKNTKKQKTKTTPEIFTRTTLEINKAKKKFEAQYELFKCLLDKLHACFKTAHALQKIFEKFACCYYCVSHQVGIFSMNTIILTHSVWFTLLQAFLSHSLYTYALTWIHKFLNLQATLTPHQSSTKTLSQGTR